MFHQPTVSLKFQMCTQILEVSQGIEITNVTVSAGHPSSSSIYPACFAPYVITTACSDGTVRFWKCETVDKGVESGTPPVKYKWHEWEMMIRTEDTSAVKVPGLYYFQFLKHDWLSHWHQTYSVK